MSATCRGCGKPIVWGVTADGKKIPLDPRAPVYEVPSITPTTFGTEGERIGITRNLSAMVSHFATCPQANQFSGSKKKGPAE